MRLIVIEKCKLRARQLTSRCGAVNGLCQRERALLSTGSLRESVLLAASIY
jgi:hypothetical protein